MTLTALLALVALILAALSFVPRLGVCLPIAVVLLAVCILLPTLGR